MFELVIAPSCHALLAPPQNAGRFNPTNPQLARVAQIHQCRLIEQRLAAEDRTPTMKLKRTLVKRKYAAPVESMVGAKAAAGAGRRLPHD